MVTGVPLGSFLAFRTEPGLQEVLPGDTIPANKWSLLVPRFVNQADPTSKGEYNDWVVLPIALDSHDLCEQKASTLRRAANSGYLHGDLSNYLCGLANVGLLASLRA